MQTPSSPATADTVALLRFAEAGREDPTARPKRKRKRTMAGHQVEQTTTAGRSLTPHQQPPEHGTTILPIKQRRVTNNRWNVVGSSTAEQAAPEPMAAESAMGPFEGSRPVAVVRPQTGNLQTTSDTITFTGNEHTPATVQDMPEPMEGAPVTTATNRDKLFSLFTASQQNDLRTHSINPGIQAVLHNAGILLKTLDDRDIQLSLDRGRPPAPSLFSKLKSFNIVKESQVLSGYFANARIFFLYTRCPGLK